MLKASLHSLFGCPVADATAVVCYPADGGIFVFLKCSCGRVSCEAARVREEKTSNRGTRTKPRTVKEMLRQDDPL